jgi:hypothetical protein
VPGHPSRNNRSPGIDPSARDCVICSSLELQQRLRFVPMGKEILNELPNRR